MEISLLRFPVKTLGPWLFVILEVAGDVRGVEADLKLGMPKAKRWGKAKPGGQASRQPGPASQARNCCSALGKTLGS